MLLYSLLISLGLAAGSPAVAASQLDSAYVFAYATNVNGGRNGLHIAWSGDCVA